MRGMKTPSEVISKLMSGSRLKQPDWQECKGLFKKETGQVSSSGEQQEVFSKDVGLPERQHEWGQLLKELLNQ